MKQNKTNSATFLLPKAVHVKSVMPSLTAEQLEKQEKAMQAAFGVLKGKGVYPDRRFERYTSSARTANITGHLLVTRNRKDFRGANLRCPYELQDGQVFNVALPSSSS